MNRLTVGQRKKIWVVAGNLNLDEENLRDLCEAVSGQRSISKLDSLHAGELIKRLEKLDGSGKRISRDRMTPGQKAKLTAMLHDMGWNEKRINGLCRKMTSVDSWNWLSFREANNIIEALKSIKRREANERA